MVKTRRDIVADGSAFRGISHVHPSSVMIGQTTFPPQMETTEQYDVLILRCSTGQERWILLDRCSLAITLGSSWLDAM